VRPIDDTPTEPVDYALLSATYGGLLATLAFAASRRPAETEPLTAGELVPLGLATFALSKTLVHEKIETWARRPFVAEDGTGERRPRGRRLRYAVGELMTCTRCMGTWSALGLVALRVGRPPAGRAVVSVLAAAGMNDFLQSGFAWCRAEATSLESRAAREESHAAVREPLRGAA
jgi:Protein of unknown function (DUF1360)